MGRGKRNRKAGLVIRSLILLVCVQGCKWRDDFRDRAQPQMLEQSERATLNIDSTDYMTNPTCEEKEIQQTPLPDIDNLSIIPEVPEHPCGI